MDPNEQGNTNMGRAKRFLGLTQDESEAVSRLAVPEQAAGAGKSFYDAFAVAGIRVDRVEPGLVVCSFKVPPRLTVSHLISSLPCSFGYKCMIEVETWQMVQLQALSILLEFLWNLARDSLVFQSTCLSRISLQRRLMTS
ncbi:uncharacterized protein [Malus domestica]|uniref:uncharacterized protein isoform X4 n=1 Tax=Malus domestica TaxID=3750 RepID=UPI003975A950